MTPYGSTHNNVDVVIRCPLESLIGEDEDDWEASEAKKKKIGHNSSCTDGPNFRGSKARQ